MPKVRSRRKGKRKTTMAEDKKAEDISKLSFEEAIGRLTDMVGKIEQGQIPLSDSIGQYEKGMALIKHCRKILQEAEKSQGPEILPVDPVQLLPESPPEIPPPEPRLVDSPVEPSRHLHVFCQIK